MILKNILSARDASSPVLRGSLFALMLSLPLAYVPAAVACPEHDKAAAQAEGHQKVAHAGETGAAAAAVTTASGMQIEAPWSRATAAGARVAGGYLVLTNKGGEDDVLLTGSTAISEKFEVHEMAVTDGVMRMRKLDDGLPVKAGESVELKPGSFHLMFMGLKQPLKEGETFTAELEFKNAGKVPVTFTVHGLGARDAGHDHGHDHGAKDAATKDAASDGTAHKH